MASTAWFDWDDGNLEHAAESNGLALEEIEQAFTDPHRQRGRAYNQPTPLGLERRQVIVGETQDGRLLFVVFTMHGAKIRPIAARVADADERRVYRRAGRRG